VVGELSASDPNSDDRLEFDLVNSDNGLFVLSDNHVVVAEGAILDFEKDSIHEVTVRVTDAGGQSIEKTFTITVTDLAPGVPFLSGNLIQENASSGTVVGQLSVVDPHDKSSLGLVDTAGGRFMLVNDQIVVAPGASLDFETSSSWNVVVRATDGGQHPIDRTFTIWVGDIAVEDVRGTSGSDIIRGGSGKDVCVAGSAKTR
jgi:hypothetical protein